MAECYGDIQELTTLDISLLYGLLYETLIFFPMTTKRTYGIISIYTIYMLHNVKLWCSQNIKYFGNWYVPFEVCIYSTSTSRNKYFCRFYVVMMNKQYKYILIQKSSSLCIKWAFVHNYITSSSVKTLSGTGEFSNVNTLFSGTLLWVFIASRRMYFPSASIDKYFVFIFIVC